MFSLFLFLAYFHDEGEKVVFFEDDDIGRKLVMLDVDLEFLYRFVELCSQMVFSFRSHSNHETDTVVDVQEGDNVRDGTFFLLGLPSSLLLDAH